MGRRVTGEVHGAPAEAMAIALVVAEDVVADHDVLHVESEHGAGRACRRLAVLKNEAIDRDIKIRADEDRIHRVGDVVDLRPNVQDATALHCIDGGEQDRRVAGAFIEGAYYRTIGDRDVNISDSVTISGNSLPTETYTGRWGMRVDQEFWRAAVGIRVYLAADD